MEASHLSATDTGTDFTSSHSIVEASIAIFAGKLQHEWNYQRTPKGLQQAFTKANTLKHTATERIFLDHGGKAAWLAFFRATHTKRQQSQNTTIASFHKESTETRIIAAKRVAAFAQDPSVAKVIPLITHRRRHRRRVPPRVEAQQNLTAPSATSSPCATPPPYETQNSSAASATFERSPPKEPQSIPITIPAPLSNADQPVRVLEHASQQGIADVFEKRICDAIKGQTIQRNGTTYLEAAVTMSFPNWVMYDCIMTLAIHESKVADLLNALFNIQEEWQGHVRCLVFPGGSKAVLSSELTLKGVSDNVISDVFGPEIYAAVAISNLREEELANGVVVPQGVSIILPASFGDTVVINLVLETLKAVQIRNKIFPLK